ncbi:exodeoxyribonuclease V subunit gamma [Noviherbaspirillum pedocola]|uniref:RecBCD enzyme subunit RecC n=1 Tax=Noviherbaspirillum pedocola TaxID=2801341 RepID=A0A934T145_9BURK|nr:exodeoxyribonuclease V subunit gamma [Noviherbaspirillum pedocola]MBK4739130.1 exodeoxyribonuclease V subunit gamma [Noviherbaspirillum pedocola]
MPANITPGFIALHGNQMEELRAAVFGWMREHPLDPLEEDIFLVQSNGVAEWLKIALANEMGVCAATQVMLPARFLWQAYRRVLGPEAVPRRSAFERAPLTWRLMRLLPGLLDEPGFEPLRQFLSDGDVERRLQLAQRLSDLMDQYQVYRADWLVDWAEGRDQLRPARGEALEMAPDARWQAQLWRALLADLPDEARASGRADVHARFVEMLQSGAAPRMRLPRRVVLFGISALPWQTLQALGALAQRMQVIIAVPNPCRFYWGDIIAGRDLLTAQRRRQPLREGRDLSAMPMEALHAHSHPLLAGWGRLGRDFIRMLDEFDAIDAAQAETEAAKLRVDLFGEEEGQTLLAGVQAAIRDLLPPGEHPQMPPEDPVRSIEFHVAHSAQREVEVLHDRLLHLLAEGKGRLRPADIMVMVPDIESFAPAVRAVFGQYEARDKRHIPFEVVDIAERRVNPLLSALEWLLRLPEQRCQQSEIRDLIDVPALAARFGIAAGDLPLLSQWIHESGVRWGLDHGHRHDLGLGAAGDQNAWIFGIRRMLLGYASGAGGAFAGIEPYGEVGGLDAGLAGSLAWLVDALLYWRGVLAQPAAPRAWGAHARALLKAFFHASDERDRLTLARLEEALQNWLDDCAAAGFDEAAPVAVLREAWLGAIDEPTLNARFVSGGVTFCTLMPMRAIPYRMVCLLGMNDGDFPRRAQRADFDLLALPQLARPGDRSRRDDDRYLMLEALLSARECLYVSWAGRNVRDNSEQPPSVLVSQLRDYLALCWGVDLRSITTEHPLQPFSRRYFERDGLLTYAREWAAAHQAAAASSADERALPPLTIEPGYRLRLAELARFIRQPVRQFFRHRLQVAFEEAEPLGRDDEPFALTELDEFRLGAMLMDDGNLRDTAMPADASAALHERAARLRRQGLLPLGLFGAEMERYLVNEFSAPYAAWLELCRRYELPADKMRIAQSFDELTLEDWLDRLHSDGERRVWLAQSSGRMVSRKGQAAEARPHRLIDAWVRQLAAAAQGEVLSGFLVGRDVVIAFDPLEQDEARAVLGELLACWREGMARPLPAACKTALELIANGDPKKVFDGGFREAPPGEVNGDPCLARLWPDFDSFAAEPGWEEWCRRLYGPLADWSARHVHVLSLERFLGAGDEA